jgi:hypothetical protein
MLQLQATVKIYGVFASHWISLAFAPEWCVRGPLIGDSGDLVKPLMQAVNQTARHFAHICYFTYTKLLTINMADNYF